MAESRATTSAEVALSADDPETVVDLSNVARSQIIGGGGPCCTQQTGAHLHRLEILIRAWHAQMGGAPSFSAFADASLRSRLCTGADRDRLRMWERNGLVHVTQYADPDLLHAADRLDSAILSNDLFRPFRRTYPKIFSDPERTVRWGRQRGTVTLERGLRQVWDGDVSRAEEDDELRSARIAGNDLARILDRSWRCGQEQCLAHRLYPERLLLLPRVKGETVVCPACEEPLIDLGKASRSIAVKVSADNELLGEFRLGEGDQVVLGRGRSVYDLGSVSNAARISRHHLELRVLGNSLQARDPGSRNGSELLQWEPQAESLEFRTRLSHDWTPVQRRNAIRIAGNVLLRTSGRRWPGASSFPAGKSNYGPTEIE